MGDLLNQLPAVKLPVLDVSTLIQSTTQQSLKTIISFTTKAAADPRVATALQSDDNINKFANLEVTDGQITQAVHTTLHNDVPVTPHPIYFDLSMTEAVSAVFATCFFLAVVFVLICYYSYKKCACCKNCKKENELPKTISKGNLEDILVVARAAENKIETAADFNSEDDEIYSQQTKPQRLARSHI